MHFERLVWKPPNVSFQTSGSGGKLDGEPTHNQQRNHSTDDEGRKLRRGGRRRNNPGGNSACQKIVLVTISRGHRRFIVIQWKSHLLTRQHTSMLIAACEVFVMFSDHAVVVVAQEEGAALAKAVTEWRAKKEQSDNKQERAPKPWGPPAPTLLVALVEALVKEDDGNAMH